MAGKTIRVKVRNYERLLEISKATTLKPEKILETLIDYYWLKMKRMGELRFHEHFSRILFLVEDTLYQN